MVGDTNGLLCSRTVASSAFGKAPHVDAAPDGPTNFSPRRQTCVFLSSLSESVQPGGLGMDWPAGLAQLISEEVH